MRPAPRFLLFLLCALWMACGPGATTARAVSFTAPPDAPNAPNAPNAIGALAAEGRNAPLQMTPEPRPDTRDNQNILTRSFFASLLLGDPFSGLGLLDFLIVGLAAFLIYRVTRNTEAGDADKEAPEQKPGETEGEERRYGPGPESDAYKRAAQNWDILRTRSTPEPSTAKTTTAPARSDSAAPPRPPPIQGHAAPPTAPAQETPSGPSDTEAEEFIRGAKIVYCRIYDSLASADLADVKHFTSAIMFEELKPLSGRRLGQLLLVEAATLDMKHTAGIAQARVAFDVLLQKEDAPQPEQIHEIWRFHRDQGDPKSTWRLAAIER